MERPKEIIFLDLETTGLPWTKSFSEYYHYSDLKYYDSARVVQIGMLVYDWIEKRSRYELTHEYDLIIKPDGYVINNAHLHGITQEIATTKGLSFPDAAAIINEHLANADILVAHNILFDKNVLCSELHRYKCTDAINNLLQLKEFCTSKNSTNITKIRMRRGGYKQPKLVELYRFVFKKDPSGKLHTALNDCKIMAEIFFCLLDKQEYKI